MILAHTAAILVTYYPNETLERNITSLLEQVEWIIIVDNTDMPQVASVLETISNSDRVIILFNGVNFGIARALNQGLDWARLQNCNWVFTFDQDSFAPAGFCTHLFERFIAMEALGHNLMLTSPVYVDSQSHIHYQFGRNSKRESFIEATMTSGNMLLLERVLAIGGFREDYFIDYVDFEFNLRARCAGYSLLEVPEAVLEHNLGDSQCVTFFGKFNVLVTNHSPLRRYYNARNRVRTYMEYATKKPRWVGRDLLGFAKELTKIVLYEKDALRKIKAVLLGIWDGFTGCLGKTQAKF